MFAGNFNPLGWLDCDGTLLHVNDYPALYALLGITYGGDGIHTFALPDLRGRLPYSLDITYMERGQKGGSTTLALTQDNLPAHTHSLIASKADGTSRLGTDMVPAVAKARRPVELYNEYDSQSSTQLDSNSIEPTGLGEPFECMPPYTSLRFCICAEGGLWPPRP
jgi:microcystin-dependent protein